MLKRDRHWDRNDLSRDGLANVPAKSVVLAVNLDHGGRGLVGRAVTLQTGHIHHQRFGQEKYAAGRGLALRREFFQLRVIAENLYDVGFPVHGAIAQVGGIQGSLLVAVV